MELIRKGNRLPMIFEGTCRMCGAVFEAKREELRIETCPREHYEFAHHICPECGAGNAMKTLGMGIIFHMKKPQ